MANYKNPIKYFDSITKIQTQYYIMHKKCQYPKCDVLLFWEDHGSEDAGMCFRVNIKNCGCYPEPILCCENHILDMAQIYQCPECIEAELAERMAKLDEEDEDE
jgi:ssDNA-binding Zn-finger/Zn-ribbon topoisomerase 1